MSAPRRRPAKLGALLWILVFTGLIAAAFMRGANPHWLTVAALVLWISDLAMPERTS